MFVVSATSLLYLVTVAPAKLIHPPGDSATIDPSWDLVCRPEIAVIALYDKHSQNLWH